MSVTIKSVSKEIREHLFRRLAMAIAGLHGKYTTTTVNMAHSECKFNFDLDFFYEFVLVQCCRRHGKRQCEGVMT